MDKLINISSAEYDKAEALAIIHAIVMPLAFSAILYFVIPRGFLIGGFGYTGLMITIHVIRSFFTKSQFEKEKSKMYFNLLKYTMASFLLAMLALAALVTGGAS